MCFILTCYCKILIYLLRSKCQILENLIIKKVVLLLNNKMVNLVYRPLFHNPAAQKQYRIFHVVYLHVDVFVCSYFIQAQYILIHQALIEHNQFGETEIPLSEFHSQLNCLRQTDGNDPSLLELEYQVCHLFGR